MVCKLCTQLPILPIEFLFLLIILLLKNICFFTAPKNKNTKMVKENVFYTCDDDKNEKKIFFYK